MLINIAKIGSSTIGQIKKIVFTVEFSTVANILIATL